MRPPPALATNRLRMLGCAVLTATALAAAPAHASCTALGVVSCTAAVSAGPLAFGNYNPASASPLDASSTVTVTGTMYGVGLLTTLGYSISLNAGSAGTVADRRLVGPGSLAYNLYTSAGYGTVWGQDSVSGSLQTLATVLGSVQSANHTVHGRIAPGQWVAPGSYTSTITVTVTY